jgi:head-tail adaptor
MSFSVNKFADHIKFLKRTGPSSGWDNAQETQLIKECWGSVLVRSSSESSKFGVSVASTVITVQTYYDPAIAASMIIEWLGDRYEIHGQPQILSDRRTQIITAIRESNG